MRLAVLVLSLPLLTVPLTSCRTAVPPSPAPAAAPASAQRVWKVSPDLEVSELRPGVWLHTSWNVLGDGTRFPSNGLIVREGDELLLVDTAWGEPLTEELLVWIERELRLPVARAVATHSHDDRLGGIGALARRGRSMWVHPMTRELAGKAGSPLPEVLPELVAVGGAARVGSAEVFYAGPGHTPDNLFVWLPASKVLFGGCAVRAAGTKNLGNVADAVVAEWPRTIERVMARYPEAEVVVPGHGAVGGPDLLAHTLSLLRR